MNTVGSGDFLTDLMQFLFDFAFSQGFGVAQISKDEEYRPLADKTRNLIIINTNWKNKSELPFIIGHEIGHLMDGDVGLSYYCGNALTSKEHHADLYSLNLIFDYATRQYDCFNEPSEFMRAYGIPVRMYDSMVELFRKHNDLLF